MGSFGLYTKASLVALPVFEGGREEAALCALLHQGDVVLESPQLFELTSSKVK